MEATPTRNRTTARPGPLASSHFLEGARLARGRASSRLSTSGRQIVIELFLQPGVDYFWFGSKQGEGELKETWGEAKEKAADVWEKAKDAVDRDDDEPNR